MDDAIHFDAPWSTSVKVVTLFASCLLVGIPLIVISQSAVELGEWTTLVASLPMLILVGAAFYMIRGYTITNNKLMVRRLGWRNEIDLSRLEDVEIDPTAMQRSLRTFGNGGLFCFAGSFRNKKLGPYRAYATDPNLAVVLTLTDKIIVVTPGNPRKFAATLAFQKQSTSNRR